MMIFWFKISKNEEPHNLPDGILFRKENVNVVSSTKIIHQGVYPESKIIKDIDDTLSILNNPDLPYLVRVALFHYFLGYIHPFYDGNVPLRYQQQIAA